MKVSVNRACGRLSRGIVKWIGTLPHHSGDYIGIELESESRYRVARSMVMVSQEAFWK